MRNGSIKDGSIIKSLPLLKVYVASFSVLLDVVFSFWIV